MITDGGIFLTVDGGKNWKSVYSEEQTKGYWNGHGLEVTTTYGVHVNPKNKDIMYISYTDIGLFKSMDGGKSWKYIAGGMPNKGYGNIFWLEIDPENTNRLYAVTSKTHDMPEDWTFKKDVTTYLGGFSISEDGGETWKKSMNGLPENAMTCVLMDPASSPKSRVLYVTVMGRGVYKSVDGGNKWVAANKGLGPNLNAWRMIYSKGKLYLIVAADLRNKPNCIGAALYSSSDKANTWQKVSIKPEFHYLLDVAVHPTNPDTIYVCGYYGYPELFNKVEHPGGVWRSDDAGKTWKQILDKKYVHGITVDERAPDMIYACYNEDNDQPSDSGVYVSKDKGEKWENIKDFPFRGTHRVIVHPDDINHLYVTTFGGGVLTNK